MQASYIYNKYIILHIYVDKKRKASTNNSKKNNIVSEKERERERNGEKKVNYSAMSIKDLKFH